MKPPLPQSFSFFFFIEKIFKIGNCTVKIQWLWEQTLFSNVFPKNLKKLQNLPRKPTCEINIITVLLKKAERYVAEDYSSVIINYIVKNTSEMRRKIISISGTVDRKLALATPP